MSQVIKLNKKSATVKTIKGEERTVKVRNLSELTSNLIWLIQDIKEIKKIFNFYAPQFKDDSCWGKTYEAYCPSKATIKKTQKAVKQRKQCYNSKSYQKQIEKMANTHCIMPRLGDESMGYR